MVSLGADLAGSKGQNPAYHSDNPNWRGHAFPA
jgi:hypothetical protein